MLVPMPGGTHFPTVGVSFVRLSDATPTTEETSDAEPNDHEAERRLDPETLT